MVRGLDVPPSKEEGVFILPSGAGGEAGGGLSFRGAAGDETGRGAGEAAFAELPAAKAVVDDVILIPGRGGQRTSVTLKLEGGGGEA